MSKSFKDQKHIWIYMFLCIFIILFCFQCIFPAQSDDYSHYLKATNPNLGFLHSYFSWNGRIGEILYVGFFARFNDTIWLNLIGAFMGSTFVLVFFVLIFAHLPRSRDLMSVCFLCFCLITLNDFAANFLWNSGYFNYLFGCLLIMIFWLPFRLFWQKILDTKDWYKRVLPPVQRFELKEITISYNGFRAYFLPLALLSFFAGMGSEHMGVWSIAMGVVMFIYAWYLKVRFPIGAYFIFVCFLAGYLCLYFSPGSAYRALVSKDSFISFSTLFNSSFLDFLHLFFSSFNHLYDKSFAVFLIAFIVFYLERVGAKWYEYILFILLGIIALVITRHIAGF